jgi:hypothetical protein
MRKQSSNIYTGNAHVELGLVKTMEQKVAKHPHEVEQSHHQSSESKALPFLCCYPHVAVEI